VRLFADSCYFGTTGGCSLGSLRGWLVKHCWLFWIPCLGFAGGYSCFSFVFRFVVLGCELFLTSARLCVWGRHFVAPSQVLFGWAREHVKVVNIYFAKSTTDAKASSGISYFSHGKFLYWWRIFERHYTENDGYQIICLQVQLVTCLTTKLSLKQCEMLLKYSCLSNMWFRRFVLLWLAGSQKVVPTVLTLEFAWLCVWNRHFVVPW